MKAKLDALSRGEEDVNDSDKLSLPFERVVLVFCLALLNPSKTCLESDLYSTHVFLLEQVDVDVQRVASYAKVTQVGKPSSKADEDFRKRLNFVSIGHNEEPCVVIDKFGIILLWHLPDILVKELIVSNHFVTRPDSMSISIHRKIIITLQSVSILFYGRTIMRR